MSGPVETYLGVDLGASSGRVMAGWLTAERRLHLEEIHRFGNVPMRQADALVWNFEGLMSEILRGLEQGIRLAQEAGRPVVSIGIDSWGVDFGLVDDQEQLICPVYHYRDARNDGQMDRVFDRVPREEVFGITGIQFLPFNTIYQLNAVRESHPEWLEQARHFMMIADLVAWRLTGQVTCEFTNATTTQLIDAETGEWSKRLLDALELPARIFPRPIRPGEIVGRLKPELCQAWSTKCVQVMAVATHDTGSAVVAVPATVEKFAYVSSGTWSLLGTEEEKANRSAAALAANFTNEGGVEHTFRLLKNIMGLWILQECQRQWKDQGQDLGWAEILKLAEAAEPWEIMDVDDARFLAPKDMLAAIREWYDDRHIPPPETVGEIARAVLHSLAACYARTLRTLESLTGLRYDALHIVGGGSQNRLLSQWAAAATLRPVFAGPVEATVIGNIGLQMLASDEFESLAELRDVIANSFEMEVFTPY